MNEPIKVIIEGDQITERNYSPDELKQLEQDKIESDKLNAEFAIKEAEAAAKKAAAEAKLAALGLTADDLKALGLG